MRLSAPLIAALVALATAPAGANATGGAAAPGPEGGHAYGQPTLPALRVARFSVAPAVLRPGTPAHVSYRLTGARRSVRVSLEVTRVGAQRPARRIPLGLRATGRRHTFRWTPSSRDLAPGRYHARLRAERRAAPRATATSRRSVVRLLPPPPPAEPAPTPTPTPEPTPAPAPMPAPSGVFPVQGPSTYGAADARFGALRGTHVHRGQDVIAAEGTPLVAPQPGVVHWRDYQASGAGHFLVIRGDDGRDLVFMHLRDGSVAVAQGTRVTAGQRIGDVGHSGHATGPHLHFEIWPDGWFSTPTSAPVDPLPDLLTWAGRPPAR